MSKVGGGHSLSESPFPREPGEWFIKCNLLWEVALWNDIDGNIFIIWTSEINSGITLTDWFCMCFKSVLWGACENEQVIFLFLFFFFVLTYYCSLVPRAPKTWSPRTISHSDVLKHLWRVGIQTIQLWLNKKPAITFKGVGSCWLSRESVKQTHRRKEKKRKRKLAGWLYSRWLKRPTVRAE